MHGLVVGGTGMIGAHVLREGLAAGHTFVATTRSRTRPKNLPAEVDFVTWDTRSPLQTDAPFDAVVSLAGANLTGRRWSAAYKAELARSRIETNRHIAAWAKTQSDPPSVYVCSNAVGVYGATPPGPVDETAPPGDDFLARLCVDWQHAAEGAGPETRVVTMRGGIALDPAGGALGRLLPFFRLGLGGPVGSGRQPFPWITAHDEARVILAALEDDRYRGPINVVAPQSVDNLAFTKALGHALNRPAFLPVPAFVLRLAFGEGADVLVSGQEVVPASLKRLGFTWDHPDLQTAFDKILSR